MVVTVGISLVAVAVSLPVLCSSEGYEPAGLYREVREDKHDRCAQYQAEVLPVSRGGSRCRQSRVEFSQLLARVQRASPRALSSSRELP